LSYGGSSGDPIHRSSG